MGCGRWLMGHWSKRLAQRFGISLPADVVAWYDEEVWRSRVDTHFSEPVPPEYLLATPPSTLWGGLMLPDTLPILDNGFGDVIAMRFGFDGAVREFVEWDHEGGSWHPIAQDLHEVLVYDAVRSESEAGPDSVLRWADWCMARRNDSEGRWARFRDSLADELRPTKSPGLLSRLLGGRATHPTSMERAVQRLARLLDELGYAEVAIRRDLTKESLTTGLERACHQAGGQSFADKIGIDWPTLERWMFDPSSIPSGQLPRLERITGCSRSQLRAQDWDQAESHAKAVLAVRDDLAWPHAVAGLAAEKCGDTTRAINHYTQGLEAHGTTGDFTMRWCTSPTELKNFAVKRLQALLLEERMSEHPYLNVASRPDAPHRSESIMQFWLDRGRRYMRSGQFADAYRCFYAAGWDDPVYGDHLREILENLIEASAGAGASGLTAIARYHLACFNK